MAMHGGWMMMRSLSQDDAAKHAKLKPGTTKRVLGYAAPYRRSIIVFLVLVVFDALLVVATPLILKEIVDRGVGHKDTRIVVWLAVLAGIVAIVDAGLGIVERWISARLGEGLIYDLRGEVFSHVQRQPIAFFTRAQTGALVTRLNSDVIGAQTAFTSVMSNVVSNVVSVAVILVAMAALSWQITLASLLLVPFFLIPTRILGRKLAGLTRGQMVENADLGARMTERFNVAGALLVKLFGRPDEEDREYAERAARVRDFGVSIAVQRAVFLVGLTLLATLATAIVYGMGGVMAVRGELTVGTLLALAALLGRLYSPLTQLSSVRIDIMTALVSFERVFEVLDLKPLVREIDRPTRLPEGPLAVEMTNVSFRYPMADEISIASLETVLSRDKGDGDTVLRGVSFTAAPGQMVALVGPSGAGKTTTVGLLSRLYDPTSGVVRVGGVDLREAALESVRDRIGVVTQEAHMFHDTIRANLLYARPEATEAEVEQALRDAQVWDLVSRLPYGLDTLVGDRGHRLSGGEKQRLAIARLLLKEPSVIVLDEATAHLDSESEVAVQRALDTALRGRTSIVIAHRLSTVRDADQILVVDGGRIVERGGHEELLRAGGVYAELYRTQFREEPSADLP
ncbi:ABC transporter ATP-binding protein [Rudaeicoccus suwonensis]|uniref:ATP-binding cassette subfamily B protein n=1 Tax=Rudaeicoccus suwonensis TaxID=657409 RepID=A0A561EAR7_9MICO|nr:ABC transporter ATP-binding protein [Rudaeicoccus suwonensis]TWE12704.1 ATP-binding cassette subfamily B protein [Rudaeicoccus suwonensis]